MAFDIPAENMLIARGSVILQFWVLSSLGLHQRQYWGGLVLYTFGTGFAAAMRSVAISMIVGQTSRDIARLLPTIAIMEALGVLFSRPLPSLAFRWGMKLGDTWLGMPFLLRGILFAFIMIVTFTVSLRDLSIL